MLMGLPISGRWTGPDIQIGMPHWTSQHFWPPLHWLSCWQGWWEKHSPGSTVLGQLPELLGVVSWWPIEWNEKIYSILYDNRQVLPSLQL